MLNFRRALVVLATFCFVMLGVTRSVAARDAQAIVGWKRTLDKTSTLLKDGAYAKARSELIDLTEDMVEYLGPSDAANRVFLVVIAQRALAEAGLDQIDEAVWYWEIAQNNNPKIAESDLSSFGAPAAILKGYRYADIAAACPVEQPGAERPSIVSKTQPKYPAAAVQFHDEGKVVVRLEISRDGVPHHPRIISFVGSTVTYAALEALKTWRWSMPEGNTLEAYPYCITVLFQIK